MEAGDRYLTRGSSKKHFHKFLCPGGLTHIHNTFVNKALQEPKHNKCSTNQDKFLVVTYT